MKRDALGQFYIYMNGLVRPLNQMKTVKAPVPSDV